MKYDAQFANQFKKDLKLAKKQRKNLDKPFETIEVFDGAVVFVSLIAETQKLHKRVIEHIGDRSRGFERTGCLFFEESCGSRIGNINNQ